MPLFRAKLKHGTVKLKAYEKIIWMIELGAIYLLGPKDSLLRHPKKTALKIQFWVGLLHNIMIHKCCFLGLVALSPGIQRLNIAQKTNGKARRGTLTCYLGALFRCPLWLD